MESALVQILQRLAAIEKRLALASPPVASGEVTVGENTYKLRALRPAEWLEFTNELPAFFVTWAAADMGKELSAEDIEELYAVARRWLINSLGGAAPSERDLDLMSVPQAIEVVREVMRINGADDVVAQFFRRARELGSDGGSDSSEVRDTASPSAETDSAGLQDNGSDSTTSG